MKKLFIFLFTLLSTYFIYAQGCLPEGITFTTQTQIDSFPINYPGCDTIEGNVVIQGQITNFTALSGIAHINGSLEIRACSMNNPQGLENLNQIGGNLIIDGGENSTGFVNLIGLDNLESVGGDLEVSHSSIESLEGLGSLTNVGGNVTIGGSLNFMINPGNWLLTDLNGLSNLSTIGGRLLIGYNDLLTDLSGLESLVQVETVSIVHSDSLQSLSGIDGLTNTDYLSILDCPELSDLSGLENLGSLNAIYIRLNESLTDLSGTENISSIHEISIINNPALSNLSGLDNLDHTVIENLSIYENQSLSICDLPWICDFLSAPTGTVNIYNNDQGCENPSQIASVCGITLPCLPYGNYHFTSQDEVDNFQNNYPACSELEGDLLIHGEDYNNPNSDITHLDGLSSITSVSGRCVIENNQLLENVDGLYNLSSIGEYLSITNNESLTSINGFAGLDSIGTSLGISNNPNLTSLSGLEGLTVINGSLYVGSNDGLSDMSSMLGINSVGGDLNISYNDELTMLYGLNNINSIGGDFKISSNEKLADITDIGNFPRVYGRMDIYNNPALISLEGLENLTTVDERLYIRSNDSLQSLSGLNNLDSVGDRLEISNNYALNSLAALGNLQCINWLTLSMNYTLESLSGLDNLDPESLQKIYIGNNPLLYHCEVESICSYLALPGADVYIDDNTQGCNTPEEVEEACASFVPDHADANAIRTYPNPAKDALYIQCENGVSLTEICLYNQTGRRVLYVKGSQETIDISMLPKGLYIVELLANTITIRKKLLVQ